MLNTQFLYQQNAYFILFNLTDQNFNITFCKNFIELQRSIGQQKRCNVQFFIFSKNYKKTTGS